MGSFQSCCPAESLRCSAAPGKYQHPNKKKKPCHQLSRFLWKLGIPSNWYWLKSVLTFPKVPPSGICNTIPATRSLRTGRHKPVVIFPTDMIQKWSLSTSQGCSISKAFSFLKNKNQGIPNPKSDPFPRCSNKGHFPRDLICRQENDVTTCVQMPRARRPRGKTVFRDKGNDANGHINLFSITTYNCALGCIHLPRQQADQLSLFVSWFFKVTTMILPGFKHFVLQGGA